MISSKPNRYQRMYAILQEHFTPEYIDLIDESNHHQVPHDGESHFKLTLVSVLFKGLARIERHRKVNDIFQPERQKGLHALSLALYSPEEWAKQPKAHSTPPCQHQSKGTQ